MKMRLEIADMMQQALANIAHQQVEAKKMKRATGAKEEAASTEHKSSKELSADANSDSAAAKEQTADDLAATAATADPSGASALLSLLSEVRAGKHLAAADMAKLSSLFDSSITLERMSRKQLVRLSKFFGLVPYLSDALLRMQLTRKIRALRRDDQVSETLHMHEATSTSVHKEAHSCTPADILFAAVDGSYACVVFKSSSRFVEHCGAASRLPRARHPQCGSDGQRLSAPVALLAGSVPQISCA